MKIRPMQNRKELQESLSIFYGDNRDDMDSEDYMDEVNSLVGFSTQYLFPKHYKTRRKVAFTQLNEPVWNDDLIDDEFEIETRKLNKLPKFTERLTIKEIDDLTEDERLGYYAWLNDSMNET